jgi:hypothetical protein
MICENATGSLTLLTLAMFALILIWVARSEKRSLWDAFVSMLWFQRDMDEPMALWPARLVGITVLAAAFSGLSALCPDFPATMLTPR